MEMFRQDISPSLWHELHNEETFKVSLKVFADQQPFLFAYILSRATSDPEAALIERDEIFYLGTAIYQRFLKQGNPLIEVDEGTIEAREAINSSLMQSSSEADIGRLLTGYGQELLLAQVVLFLLETQEKNGETSGDKEFLSDLLCCKTLIDCLDQ